METVDNPTPEPTSKGEAASEQWLDELRDILGCMCAFSETYDGREWNNKTQSYEDCSCVGKIRDISDHLRQRDTQLIAKLRELGPKKRDMADMRGLGQIGNEGYNDAVAEFETLFQQIERGQVL
jgi:hypothetical protein